jgi:hypothetical protein
VRKKIRKEVWGFIGAFLDEDKWVETKEDLGLEF